MRFEDYFLPADNRFVERVHATTVLGRISRRLLGDGTYGRESMSGNPDGSGSRTYVLSALSNAMRHQTLTLGRYHSQGEWFRISGNVKSYVLLTRCFLFITGELGFKAEQYSGKGRLYIEDSRFWPGQNCRYHFHDDAIRCDTIL